MLEGYKFEQVEKGYEVTSPEGSKYLVRVTEGIVGNCNCWGYRNLRNSDMIMQLQLLQNPKLKMVLHVDNCQLLLIN